MELYWIIGEGFSKYILHLSWSSDLDTHRISHIANRFFIIWATKEGGGVEETHWTPGKRFVRCYLLDEGG